MSPILSGTFTYLSLSTLISNLISVGVLALPSYTSSREAIGYAAVAGATPLLFYISIWLSLPSRAGLVLRLASHDRHESPYSNSFWLISIPALSMIATAGRYLIASSYISNTILKHYGIFLPSGALRAISAIALLELYTIFRIAIGLWKSNQALREIQLQKRSMNNQRISSKHDSLLASHSTM
ncbi:hypothetical protein BDV93DRAFT_606540 [Ceratobasidium sp. AG-I]|nr:hypothetical protein BDV93DRAFT_606540 [Ceratobasidium sp. AG-I]